MKLVRKFSDIYITFVGDGLWRIIILKGIAILENMFIGDRKIKLVCIKIYLFSVNFL